MNSKNSRHALKSYKTHKNFIMNVIRNSILILLLVIFASGANSDVISAAEEQCGANLWEMEISVTRVDDYRVIIIKYACTRGGKIINGIFYEYGEQVKLVDGYNVDFSYVGQIIDENNKIVENHIGAGDKLSIDEVPSGFPHLAFVVSRWGASNNYHSYVIYSTLPKLKKIAVIERPLNKFQANKRNGSERSVDGFYINEDGDFLIDRLVNQSVDGSSSHASRKWNVETLKLVGDHFNSVSIRDYDVETYERLK